MVWDLGCPSQLGFPMAFVFSNCLGKGENVMASEKVHLGFVEGNLCHLLQVQRGDESIEESIASEEYLDD